MVPDAATFTRSTKKIDLRLLNQKFKNIRSLFEFRFTNLVPTIQTECYFWTKVRVHIGKPKLLHFSIYYYSILYRCLSLS